MDTLLDAAWNRYQLDYVPVLFGTSESLEESTAQAGIALEYEWNKQWSSSLSWSGYEGFSEYRSVWISQFYQQFLKGFQNMKLQNHVAIRSVHRLFGTIFRARERRSFHCNMGKIKSRPVGALIPKLEHQKQDQKF